jgi:type IX secretion system PorP/SprF family membrane protein
MKRLILSYILIVSCFAVIAQQDPLISHLFMNKVYQNPAFAGQQGEICANMINRQQWVGLEGAPQTTLLSINSPIRIFGINSGIGLQITDDKLGFEKNFTGSLQYAYIQDLSSGSLSFGVQMGVLNKAFDGTWQTPDAPAQNDIAIPQQKDQSMVFDLGLGVVYTIDNLYFGLSVTHLTQPKLKLSVSEIPYIKRHYYLMSGYKFSIPNSPLEFTSNLLVQYDGGSPQIVMNVSGLYNKKFWGGVTYRTIDALDINIGLELFNGIKIGYAYGLNLSKLIKTNGGSHEFMLGYCFNFEFGKIPQKYRSVRFL